MTPEDRFLAELGTIDLHHGPYSTNTPYTALTVIGVASTKLDVLDGCKELKVCTGYRYQGKFYRDMPADLQALTDCEPVYKTFKGWSGSTTGATTYKQLPVEAKRYLQYLEDLSECPIDMISTGSKRSETIILRNPLKIRSRRS